MGLIKKLRKAKKEAPPNEKPTVVKTHLRDMIIVPEMIGSVVGIYNGKVRSHCMSSSVASVLSGCTL
jgi:ribosomal protein S19